MPENVRWVVTTSDERPIDDVADDLAAAGFSVEDVLREIRCITGAASEEVVERLRGIPGVSDIEPEPRVDIGSPDAPVS